MEYNHDKEEKILVSHEIQLWELSASGSSSMCVNWFQAMNEKKKIQKEPKKMEIDPFSRGENREL